jgi:hypothetical protein
MGALAAAGGPVGVGLAGLSMGIGIVGGLLKAHTLRLQDAKNENIAVANLVPAINQDIQEVAAATQSGNLSFDQGSTYLQGVYAHALNYLKSQVGKPGTMWTDGAPCGKTCTVGCCIWFSYLKPRLEKSIAILQSGKQGSVRGAEIPSNKYGFPGFPAFTVTFVPNHSLDASVTSVASNVSKAFKNLLGFSDTSAATVQPSRNKNWMWILAILAFVGIYVATE